MDYATFRAEGIAHIQRLAGHLWTDHNVHDPGITILEQLCFALTDLNYRIGFEVPDLMAEGGKRPEWFSPGEVMASAPATLKDFRKLLIDLPGVRNVWVFPANSDYNPRIYYDDTGRSLSLEAGGRDSEMEPLPLKGLYRILVATSAQVDADARAEVLQAVRARFHGHRGLCEDLDTLQLIEDEAVAIGAEIEVGQVDDPEHLLAQIFKGIYHYISPSIRFYTLSERLEAGYRIEEAMEGPRLDHGFIDDGELEQFQLRRHLRASDLIRLIMEVPEVRAVRRLNLGDKKVDKAMGDWTLRIPEGKAPVWTPPLGKAGEVDTPFVLLREGLPILLNWKRVEKQFLRLMGGELPAILPPSQRDIVLPGGNNRKVGEYDSIQLQFPDIYGIGRQGLSQQAAPARRAQAHQLKAYLSFLDQVLANCFAQLGHVNHLFSHEWPENAHLVSYPFHPLFADIPEYETLLAGLQATPEEEREEAKAEFIRQMQLAAEGAGGTESALIRKNRFLNHLMARFAEQMADYSLGLFTELDNENARQELIDARWEKLARDKSRFLREYPSLGYQRGTGFDYTRDSWNTENVAGLKRRICRLLGIEQVGCIPLGDIAPEHTGGFHLLEHILLRPRGGSQEGDTRQKSAFLKLPAGAHEETPPQKDPYSLRLSFIFPNWLHRFQPPLAREALLKAIRDETPAHIRVQLRWLDRAEMQEFESNYQAWLQEMKNMG